ncbi:MAG TPA: lantibiotic dehydratase, partial [Streptosporangiaceae bacterium]|nr:lantibiotic dehydratase [Streptosporangiaceae bacterium]
MKLTAGTLGVVLAVQVAAEGEDGQAMRQAGVSDWLHRVALGGSVWGVWRDVCVRGAGFAADRVLAVCDEPLAAAADRAAGGGGDRAAFEAAYARAVTRLSAGIADTYADPLFREAVTWQNPVLARFLRDHDQGPAAPRRSKQRQRELVIANYLQRYCLKNDTIGFFGPVGWATAGHDGPALTVTPGNQLIARRTTYFEVWAIDKIAAEIARHGRAHGWLRPRRTRSVFLDGSQLHRPHRKPVTLTGDELAIWHACDGHRTISQILDSAGTPDGRGLLTRLAELGALRLDLEGPMHAWPEQLLTRELEQITDPAARAAALAPVEQLITARDAVAATSGDPDALDQALADLAATFEQITGTPPTRRAGANYAGRTLVYQDTTRDVTVHLGHPITQALAAPLTHILDSARWLINDITGKYRTLFTELYDQMATQANGAPLPLQRFLTAASPYLLLHQSRAIAELAA